MKLHILAMPFSETTPDWSHCAFTQRTLDFTSMMTDAGYETYLYAGENNTARCKEHVTILTREEQHTHWPDYVPKRDVMSDFDPNSPGWRMYNARTVAAIYDRMEPKDILCITMGLAHRPIAESFADLFHVETGIGYSGVWATYRVYESRAWMNYLVGKYGPTDDAQFYHDVIPRAYEIDDFPTGKGDGGYVAYVGRLIERKGPHIAALAAARAGVPLVVAGQGVRKVEPGRITCDDGTVLEGDVSYVGVLPPAERAALMGSAMAVLTPTIYFEPFGGVSVEAQLTGTPALVSDWGGLPENVVHDQTGYVCRTLAEWTAAIHRVSGLDRDTIRERAIRKWGTEEVGWQFKTFFNRLESLLGDGWAA